MSVNRSDGMIPKGQRRGGPAGGRGLRRQRVVRGVAAVVFVLSATYCVVYRLVLGLIVARTFQTGYSVALGYVAIPALLLSLSLLMTPGVVVYNELIGHLRAVTRATADILRSRLVAVVSLAMLLAPLLRLLMSPSWMGAYAYAVAIVQYAGAILLGASIACMLCEGVTGTPD